MAAEQFVNVTYRGLDLGRRLRVTQFGPATAYLEHPTPMPVGTELTMETDDGVPVAVRVLRVQEQVAGAEQRPGMRVAAVDLDAGAKDWWSNLVSTEDPVIPEPWTGSSSDEDEDAGRDDEVAEAGAETDETDEQAGAGDAADHEEVEAADHEEVEGRNTLEMSSSEIQDAMAAEDAEAAEAAPAEDTEDAEDAEAAEAAPAEVAAAPAQDSEEDTDAEDTEAAEAAAAPAQDSEENAEAAEAQDSEAAETTEAPKKKRGRAKTSAEADSDDSAPKGKKRRRSRRRKR